MLFLDQDFFKSKFDQKPKSVRQKGQRCLRIMAIWMKAKTNPKEILNEQLLQSNLDAKLALIRSRKRRSESGLNDKDLHLEFVLRFFELKEKKKDEKLKKLEEDLRRAEIKLNKWKNLCEAKNTKKMVRNQLKESNLSLLKRKTNDLLSLKRTSMSQEIELELLKRKIRTAENEITKDVLDEHLVLQRAKLGLK